ncbi:DsbA family protein [Halomonas maura]|uniref:DsbA family protein n=1 Tax=Halomonas maura TaxID=117606 RepID=UPI0025B52466|nr:DsbA family protein [Halomonas maura]MDN3556436.1 DsbA family protein [Halomonas maura]
MRPVLHYIHDPLCGWCYAVAPLVAALVERAPNLEVRLHGGGLFENRRLDEAMVRHVRANDARIAALSGQPFGAAYRHGLLERGDTLLDSPAASAAILAVEAVAPHRALVMLEAIQRAHYREGRRVVDAAVLTELAEAQGLAPAAFTRALAAARGRVWPHIAATRRRMVQLGASGFPTLVLEQDGDTRVLDHGRYYGRPAAFAQAVVAPACGC